MSRLKDMWIDAYNDIVEELIEAGMPEDEAAEVAAESAGARTQGQIADMIDHHRLMKKEGRV